MTGPFWSMRLLASLLKCSLILALTYGLFEAGIQLMVAKGVAGGGYLQDYEAFAKKAAAANKTMREYANAAPLHPLLGWDGPDRAFGPDKAATTVLLLGDSVAYGQDANIGENDFATLLGGELASEGVRLVNAARSGYGLDQMYLSLLTRLEAYRPTLAVICFIPHDIRRIGVNFFIEAAKPRFFPDAAGPRLELPDLAGRHESFAAARKNYWLGPWYARQLYASKEYKYPGAFREYYARTLRYFAEKLSALAAQRPMKVLFADIPNMPDSTATKTLSPLANEIFGQSAGRNNLYFTQLEPCLRELIPVGSALWSEFEAEHPGPAGHGLLAQCVKKAIEKVGFR